MSFIKKICTLAPSYLIIKTITVDLKGKLLNN